MSRRARSALLLSVRDVIRTYCAYESGLCEVCPSPGKPHPRAGKWFVAVCSSPRSWVHNTSIAITMGCKVVITHQCSEAESDRSGLFSLNNDGGLYDRMGQIANELMNYRYELIQAANVYMAANYTGSAGHTGFFEPLIPQSESAEIPCGADWFGGGNPGVYGYRMELTLGGAKLLQALGAESTS